MAFLTLLTTASLNAEELTFFDFLGSMVEDDGEWLDPLSLHEAAEAEASEATLERAEAPPSDKPLPDVTVDDTANATTPAEEDVQ